MADADRVTSGRRVLAVCPGCGNARAVAARHAGAAVICPKCGRDVPVADGPDPMAPIPAPEAARPGRAGRAALKLATASAGGLAAAAGLLAALR